MDRNRPTRDDRHTPELPFKCEISWIVLCCTGLPAWLSYRTKSAAFFLYLCNMDHLPVHIIDPALTMTFEHRRSGD
jgi:hypothetical protein